MKTLAISLLNWNGIDDTIECIDSLSESIFQDFDIYIVDNGSKNDEGIKLMEKYKNQENIIISLLNKNAGFTGGNNHNLNLIRGKGYGFSLLLNNDTIIPNDFLDKLIRGADDINDGGIFGPTIKEYYDKSIIQSRGGTINLWTGNSNRIYNSSLEPFETDYVSGACFLIKDVVMDKIGVLDDDFFAYWEESDYCMRAKRQGFKIFVIPEAEIYHKEETATKKISKYYTYLMFRNRLLFLSKHACFMQYIISWIFLIGYSILLFPKKFGIKSYRYLMMGIKDGLSKKLSKELF